MKKRMQVPDLHELVIIIDGLLSAVDQQMSFDKQLAAIVQDRVQ